MPDPAISRPAEQPTRLQHVARRGCAGLAYTIVLVPLVVVIWFFSTIPRGWEQFGDLVSKILWEGPPGADTEIIILNISGHDVRLDWMRIADHETTFTGVLETEREDDPDQKIVHYQDILWARVRPRTFRVEIRYTEVDTGVARSGSFVADRRPRPRCAFVIFLRPDGPELSGCRRSDLEDFSSS
ncbi:MAG: hypothetical protein ACREJ0_06840 [Geminicoccaceae bacterium]